MRVLLVCVAGVEKVSVLDCKRENLTKISQKKTTVQKVFANSLQMAGMSVSMRPSTLPPAAFL